jgi:hypothetical protein
MKRFNVYYNNIKLNKYPLKEREVEEIKNSKFKVVRKEIYGEIVDIPIEKLTIYKCTIV